MSVLLPRTVLETFDDRTLHRVVWVEPRIGVYLFRINDLRSFPIYFGAKELEHLLTQGHLHEVSDPYANLLPDECLSPKSLSRREARWAIMKPLLEIGPDICLPSIRGPLAARRAAETGTPLRDIYRDFRRWWQRGMTVQALTPDFQNCGAPGQRKVPGKMPLGRPGTEPTFIMTPEVEEIIQSVVSGTFAKNSAYTLTATYKLFLLENFSHRVPTHSGGMEIELVECVPSLKQFTDAVKRHNDTYFLEVRRHGRANIEKDKRAILGSSTSQTFGPGSRFEIDATIANFRLRSCHSRRTVGRPVVYFVVDVFSRLIVGIYVGLEWASWAGAMQALANVVRNKVEFCSQYDIAITEEQWPSGFLPERILGDGGELAGSKVDVLLERYDIISETAEPGRGDRKAIVEKRFDMVPVKLEPFVGGRVDKDARGPVPSHERDGEYDLDGFTKAILESVIYFNTRHQLESFNDRPVEMIADGVPAIPIDMFNWGIKNRSGCLRKFEFEEVRLSLLPTVEGKVTEKGFEVLGLRYTCDHELRGRIFEQARNSGVIKATFSVDDTSVDEVFWHVAGPRGKFISCKLTPAYAQYEGMTRYEVETLREQEKIIRTQSRRGALNGELTLIDKLNAIRSEQERAAARLPQLSLSERDKHARENRLAERNEQDHRKRGETSPQSTPDRPTRSPTTSYALPALSKLRRKEPKQ